MAMKQLNQSEHYYITEDGKVFSTLPVRHLGKPAGELHELKPKINKEGRYFVGIYLKPQIRSWLSLPRLVYEHYVGPIPNDLTINHKDEIKSNNHYTNLELLTRAENTKLWYRNRRNGKTN